MSESDARHVPTSELLEKSRKELQESRERLRACLLEQVELETRIFKLIGRIDLMEQEIWGEKK